MEDISLERVDGEVLACIRELCLAFPDVSERLSHGSPAFFRGPRQFASVFDNHHGDGRFALWCAAPPLAQPALVESDPERFFVPPYVGHRGWLGFRLDRGLDRGELARILAAAHAQVGPRVRAARKPRPGL